MKFPLRQAREKAGQTIVDVCRAVGTDPGNLSRVENGKQKPSTELAEKLVKHFGGSLTEMQILYPERFSGVENTAPKSDPAARRATDPEPPEGHGGRQPPSSKNILGFGPTNQQFSKARNEQ